jgi:hypothetical protein
MPGTASRRSGAMDEAVRAYIDGIYPAHRPLFDRVHRLILAAHPDAAVVLSYRMPTYKVGRRRLCGWQQDRDAGFTDRHPELRTSKGTIRLRPQDAAGITDDELGGLVGGALDA